MLDILTGSPDLARPGGQTFIADKGYYGREFEAALPGLGVSLLRPARHGEPEQPGTRFFKPLRPTTPSCSGPSVVPRR